MFDRLFNVFAVKCLHMYQQDKHLRPKYYVRPRMVLLQHQGSESILSLEFLRSTSLHQYKETNHAKGLFVFETPSKLPEKAGIADN